MSNIENRLKLQELSRQAKELFENDINPPVLITVNEMLKHYIYNPLNTLEFDTFQGWKIKGFQVKKGEKGYLFWSKPNKHLLKEDTEQTDDTEEKDKLFFISYLFSNEQIKPL